MGVLFNPLQSPSVFRGEFNLGNYGFPPLPFLLANGITNLSNGLESYLTQSIPFPSLFTARTLLISKMDSGGILIFFYMNISAQFFLFNLNLFYPLHSAGKGVNLGGKKPGLNAYCTLFPTRSSKEWKKNA